MLRTMFVTSLALTAVLPAQDPARAGTYSYTSVISPSPITSASGLSEMTFGSVTSGQLPVEDAYVPTPLATYTETSTATTPEALPLTTIYDTVTIDDGGQSGSFTVHLTVFGSNIASGSGSYSFGIPFWSSMSMTLNGDTFEFHQFNNRFGTTNGTIGQISTDFQVIPGTPTVPEPSSLVLMCLAGAALARRLLPTSRSRRPFIDDGR